LPGRKIERVNALKLENMQLSISDRIAIVTLKTKDRPMNVLTPDVIKELSHVMDIVEKEANCLIIFAEGKHFSPGADVLAMSKMNADEGEAFSRLGQGLTTKIEELTAPVIIAVHGYAMGGAVEISVACDIRIAAESAVFGQPEINIGVLPGWGGSQRLPRVVGLSKAKELIYTGRKIDAEEALNIGLVDLVVPDEMLRPAAIGIAENIVEKPRVAIATAKCAINSLFNLPMSEGMKVERRLWRELFNTPDRTEGMTAFIEKRKPKFTDRIDEYESIRAYIKEVLTDYEKVKHGENGDNPGKRNNNPGNKGAEMGKPFDQTYMSAMQNYMNYMTMLQEFSKDMAMRNFELATSLFFPMKEMNGPS
jgi:enoyl-CoA hydratase